VHVEDIARAHVMAADVSVPYGIYNLGTASGISNKQIINAVAETTGKDLAISTGPARPGDPAVLTASADKWHRASGWEPLYNINDMISHAWAWYNR
jgi:UDP-glucose 4-epimerase